MFHSTVPVKYIETSKREVQGNVSAQTAKVKIVNHYWSQKTTLFEPDMHKRRRSYGREFHSYSFMNILNHISSSSHVKLRKGKGSGPQSDSSAMLYKYRYEIYSIPSYLIQSTLSSISPNVQIWKRLWPNCHLYQPEKQDCDYDCLHSGE